MKRTLQFACAGLVLGIPLVLAATVVDAQNSTPATLPASNASPVDREGMLNQYCAGCHNDKARTGGMSVQGLHAGDWGAGTATWEKILAKLNLGEMPPKGMKRPSPEQITDFTHWLETSLDQYGMAHPNPGRSTLRRMNRAEYANAVRDLLSYTKDVSSELPADDSGYGFDNIADVLTVSPTLMDRYIAVAGKIGRAVTGQTSRKPFATIYKTAKDVGAMRRGVPSYNERASDDLPLDSRGGGAVNYLAPYDGEYVIRAYFNANTLNDNDVLKENTIEVKVRLKAGPRTIGMYFEKPMALDETPVKVYSAANFPGQVSGIVVPDQPPTPMKLTVSVDGVATKNMDVPSYSNTKDFYQFNYPRDVLQIQVEGPYNAKGIGDSPSRRKIFLCHPAGAAEEAGCARKIITALATQAYRRPLTEADIGPLLKVYESGHRGSDFEHGIEIAVEAILVSPQFLFLEERDPPGGAPGSLHRISDLELATRLSFFLWSSIPDAQLLAVAERGQLKNPAILKQQVTRMLADPRAHALTTNFAGQWLYLRNLQYAKPDLEAYPEFDIRLRQAMATETDMFFSAVVKENRPVLDFLDANYTFLNQRLAEHYGIQGIYGPTFRRVTLDPSMHRGGLLGQGSILTVTSYDNRTSVVKRGKWILDNILAAPPPPPPPELNIPALNETPNGKVSTVRQMMEIHRANPVCASCHSKMDPLGFSLENYDAIGAWRTNYAGQPVDSSAVLPDGTKFEGPAGLQKILLARKDQFVEAFTERLMTYALSRGVEAYDMPTIRAIRRKAAADDYRIDSIILGIVQSTPFEMRITPTALKRTAEK